MIRRTVPGLDRSKLCRPADHGIAEAGWVPVREQSREELCSLSMGHRLTSFITRIARLLRMTIQPESSLASS